MKSVKSIDLALQGGGAHGAFTWGVLDRLLQEELIDIEAISGTSAGAMNAVVVAEGLVKDGCDGARQALHEFWRAVSHSANASPIQRSPIDILTGNWALDSSPGYLYFDLLSRIASPYQLNPLNLNPLKELLSAQVNFDCVRTCKKIKLFISATHVGTGRVKVFTNDELTADHVMASACLPLIFQAVEIDGQAYWDGGFMGNPVLFPLIYGCDTRDIVVVQINPFERDEVPTTAREILERMNEITFNSSLMKEFRAIDFVARLLDEGSLNPERYKHMFIHMIHSQEELSALGASSKLNGEWRFLTHLRDLGREATDRWLQSNFDALGKRSTLNVRRIYMDELD